MSADPAPAPGSLSVPRGQSLALRPGNALVTRGLRDIAQFDNRARAKELVELGKACYDKHEYDQAIAFYTEAIRLDPGYVEAYYNRIMAYSDNSQLAPDNKDSAAAVDQFDIGLNTKKIAVTVKLTRAAVDYGITVFDDYVRFIAGEIGASNAKKISEYLESAWRALRALPNYSHLPPEGKVGEVLAKLTEASQKPQIGDSMRLLGTDAILSQVHESEGVRYELYNASHLKDKRGFIRVFDVDSGKVVTLKEYPEYDQAEQEYGKTKPQPEVAPKESNTTRIKNAGLNVVQRPDKPRVKRGRFKEIPLSRSLINSVSKELETNPEMVATAMKLWLASATESEKVNGPTDDDLARTIILASQMTHIPFSEED